MTPNETEWLYKLAGLHPVEGESMEQDLEAILGYVSALQEMDVPAEEWVRTSVDVQSLKADVVQAPSSDEVHAVTEAFCERAPDGSLVVPGVLAHKL